MTRAFGLSWLVLRQLPGAPSRHGQPGSIPSSLHLRAPTNGSDMETIRLHSGSRKSIRSFTVGYCAAFPSQNGTGTVSLRKGSLIGIPNHPASRNGPGEYESRVLPATGSPRRQSSTRLPDVPRYSAQKTEGQTASEFGLPPLNKNVVGLFGSFGLPTFPKNTIVVFAMGIRFQATAKSVESLSRFRVLSLDLGSVPLAWPQFSQLHASDRFRRQVPCSRCG